jgi:3-phenylpropionate/cinnamic acid dioxygenase small subunit
VSGRFQAIYDFLVMEAAFLDAAQYRDWFALLTEDIDYRVPVRVTRSRASGLSEFSDTAFHMLEDRASLLARVERYDSKFAWAADPAPRTRRFVANVRLTGESPEGTAVTSYVLFHRGRADAAPDLISAERHNLVRSTAAGLRLARRLVLLDHTYLPTENLAAFL